jgi:hypothetical protein
MFIQEYAECDSRTQKSRLVKSVVDIALKSGYRFLAQDEWGIFAPIPWIGVQKKVSAIFVELPLFGGRRVFIGSQC